MKVSFEGFMTQNPNEDRQGSWRLLHVHHRDEKICANLELFTRSTAMITHEIKKDELTLDVLFNVIVRIWIFLQIAEWNFFSARTRSSYYPLPCLCFFHVNVGLEKQKSMRKNNKHRAGRHPIIALFWRGEFGYFYCGRSAAAPSDRIWLFLGRESFALIFLSP